jgi:hypothetical protein
MKNGKSGQSAALVDDADTIITAIQRGVNEALLDHKRTGDPIVVWRDGKVRWIPADEIVIPPVAPVKRSAVKAKNGRRTPRKK